MKDHVTDLKLGTGNLARQIPLDRRLAKAMIARLR